MSSHDTIDFIGIGAARSGSTWVAEALRQHPDIAFARQEPGDGELGFHNNKDKKELDFFLRPRLVTIEHGDSSNLHLGWDWYLEQFPPARPGQVRGEFSPAYLLDDEAPALIRERLPNVKLIATLRHPADMCYSMFNLRRNAVQVGGAMTFEEALDQGFFLEMANFGQKISRYLELFPRENLHLVRFEDIAARPEEVASGLYRFLGVRDNFLPTNIGRKVNASVTTGSQSVQGAARLVLTVLRRLGLAKAVTALMKSPAVFRLYRQVNIRTREYEPMRPETRQRLIRNYLDDIQKLEAITGWDLTDWKK